MSGHSKWHNIQKTKGAQDAKRAAAFTKIAKELIVAVKEGGSADPAYNSRLATVITKAKAANMPNDNIKRVPGKGGGRRARRQLRDHHLRRLRPRRRGRDRGDHDRQPQPHRRSDMRHHFDKFGGNLGATGCVSWSFDKKGVLVIDNEDGDYEEDQVMMDAMDCGADDFEAEDDVFTVYTRPRRFQRRGRRA